MEHVDSASSCNVWTALLVLVGLCALQGTESVEKGVTVGVESHSRSSFQWSLTSWILLDLKYLCCPPFALSSLLTV